MVIHLLLVASLQSSAHVFTAFSYPTHSQCQSIRVHEPCLNPHILNSQQFYMCTHVSITICHAPFNTCSSPFTSETQSTHLLRNIQQSAHTQVYLEASPPVGVAHVTRHCGTSWCPAGYNTSFTHKWCAQIWSRCLEFLYFVSHDGFNYHTEVGPASYYSVYRNAKPYITLLQAKMQYSAL